MLSPDLVSSVNNFIQLDIDEKVDFLARDVQECLQEMDARNLLHTSVTVERVQELCAKSVAARMQDAWRILVVFAKEAKVGYSDLLESQLIDILDQNIPSPFDDISDIYAQLSRIVYSTEPAIKQFESKLGQVRFDNFARIKGEVHQFVVELRGGNSSFEEPPHTNLGAGVLHDDKRRQYMEMQSDIQSILFSLEFALAGVNDETFPRSEVFELVQDIRKELEKRDPNMTKLEGLLVTVGSNIHTVDSLSEIYDDLKTLLTYLGATMP